MSTVGSQGPSPRNLWQCHHWKSDLLSFCLLCFSFLYFCLLCFQLICFLFLLLSDYLLLASLPLSALSASSFCVSALFDCGSLLLPSILLDFLHLPFLLPASLLLLSLLSDVCYVGPQVFLRNVERFPIKEKIKQQHISGISLQNISPTKVCIRQRWARLGLVIKTFRISVFIHTETIGKAYTVPITIY